MFEFNDFLRRINLDTAHTRLLRHDLRGVAAWRRGREVAFGCFASFQKKANSPYAGASVACHFLPGPSLDDGSATALFIGSTRIIDRWDWDEFRMPRIMDAEVIQTERGRSDIETFDLEWLAAGHDFAERILIKWGTGTRAWSQWTSRNPKEILELRLKAQEPPFPGFSGFFSRISDLPAFPQSWVSALESVRGIYLLVTDRGEQYVGSATGMGGLMERWRSYSANGHGGNVLLRRGGYRDYSVSILEVASPDMATGDILAREAFWKAKLGARAHGLNAN